MLVIHQKNPFLSDLVVLNYSKNILKTIVDNKQKFYENNKKNLTQC